MSKPRDLVIQPLGVSEFKLGAILKLYTVCWKEEDKWDLGAGVGNKQTLYSTSQSEHCCCLFTKLLPYLFHLEAPQAFRNESRFPEPDSQNH